MTARHRDERGAVTLVVAAVAGVLVAVSLVVVTGGQLLVAQRRAGRSADLGALAGAVASQRGGDPCAAARRLVAVHDDRVTRCTVIGQRVRVVVAGDVRVLAARTITVTARAQAGPR